MDTPGSPQPAPDGRTVQRREDQPEPRLPHEHDQSADDQGASPTDVGRQAKQDVEKGQGDTDRGPVMDRAYKQQKEPPNEG
jgi:hypothetical protein